jgi:hypothetical protein
MKPARPLSFIIGVTLANGLSMSLATNARPAAKLAWDTKTFISAPELRHEALPKRILRVSA